MGIVKISDGMHENLRIASDALSRSINAQAEHWMRVGMLAELHPGLDHREICQLLIRAELAGGFDLRVLAADSTSVSDVATKAATKAATKVVLETADPAKSKSAGHGKSSAVPTIDSKVPRATKRAKPPTVTEVRP
ncbi:hypothetical protein EYW45_19620 [Achromobacter sp. KS-M25]|nr:hypothetical protein [Achromobacter aestuarii]